MGFSVGKNRKNDINSPNLGFMSFHVFSIVWIFFRFFPLFFMPRKVAHKVSDHSYAARVVLWRQWAFHIAFYIFNFLEGIFIFKPCIQYPFINLLSVFHEDMNYFRIFPDLFVSRVSEIRDCRRLHLRFTTSISWRRPEN